MHNSGIFTLRFLRLLLAYFAVLSGFCVKILYIPFYLHKDDSKYKESDKVFFNKVIEYCKKINSDFDESWILAKKIHRYEYAQPVCPPGFLKMLPSIKTDVDGLYIADTSHCYPEDRSITESIRVANIISDFFEE